MGLLKEAKENQLKKKVEEGSESNSGSLPALRSKMKDRALKECDHYAAIFAECARGRTLSVAWRCREQAKKLNTCLHQYTNDEVLEEYKKNYILEQERKAKL
ncbi:uncharacterized protein LOC131028862 isoform X2 [Cryptomeria japonica]|uniref:uncharacterized protein LOC131028862 isoform X2 n=1 Tax=Cryptomeria japonica TaxID=3369 RepID=UPI0027D9E3CD|nr:uncharacterized protein LOC131028862 isoform X2 [Cryptomeria japonica]